jgi:hypothetical protein
VGIICFSTGAILVQHAIKMKKASKATARTTATTRQKEDLVVEYQGEGEGLALHGEESQEENKEHHAITDEAGELPQPQRIVAASEKQEELLAIQAEDEDNELAIFMSSPNIIQPWDKYVVRGAFLRYLAMVAYSGFNLTTIPDLFQGRAQGM